MAKFLAITKQAAPWIPLVVLGGAIVWNSLRTTEVDLEREVADLVHQLEVESLRGVEYFNSAAFDSLSAHKDNRWERWLRDRIEAPNRKSLLPLLALRRIDSAAFAQADSTFKRRVLVDALKQAVYFNGWGEPHLYWSDDSTRQLEDPVAAFVDLGESAISGLERLLDERRDAPRWGSGELTEPGIEPYQVNDYAIALIKKIEQASVPDTAFTFPNTRASRDALIRGYRDSGLARR